MSNNTKLQYILSESESELHKNIGLYKSIYKFYNDQNLSVHEIDLLIINTENNLYKKNNNICIFSNFFTAIMLSIITAIVTNSFAIYFNNKNLPNIFVGNSFLIFFLMLSFILFLFIKQASKDYQESHSDKIIYAIELKALNDLKVNTQ
ncbi:hypothetical protein [Paraclostridium tenue]|uniref:SMODS and SLOG-associating 2TM effector domain-containing protein n=1 Tax=Paraclostridium tenue TaxID=1737 RepID=A0ABN1M5Q9_9FIRM